MFPRDPASACPLGLLPFSRAAPPPAPPPASRRPSRAPRLSIRPQFLPATKPQTYKGGSRAGGSPKAEYAALTPAMRAAIPRPPSSSALPRPSPFSGQPRNSLPVLAIPDSPHLAHGRKVFPGTFVPVHHRCAPFARQCGKTQWESHGRRGPGFEALDNRRPSESAKMYFRNSTAPAAAAFIFRPPSVPSAPAGPIGDLFAPATRYRC